ncbi:putative Kin of IRRE-like protein 1 [Hypsibius exemplaris]|uniref:Kin of IRRE-like protein 1 n=1 Tax=Hypsibius exemplaris TaxID=2072580 RepID=A0A1W0WBE5_HYPEX|nr:putative Kin of IRRE-like protein 1 [Hypsibius exemplaris]
MVRLRSRGSRGGSVRCPALVSGRHVFLIYNAILLALSGGGSVSAQDYVFTQEPRNVSARVGENVSLHCTISPPAPVFWIVNGFPIITNDSYEFKYNPGTGEHEMIIKNIPSQLDGQYSCRTMNLGSGSSSKAAKTVDAFVTVLVPPTQIQLVPFSPETIVQEQGLETSLTCIVSGGKPAPVVQWFKDDRLLENGVSTHSQPGDGTRIENVTSTLKWAPIRGDHEKRISCTASHPALQGGPLRVGTKLNVEYAPVVVVSSFPEYIKEGDDVTLHCMADANPDFDLKYRWTRNGLPVSDSATSSLRIDSVQRSDKPVVYTCEASNRIGTRHNSFHLDVLYPPTFYSMQEVQSADLGTDISLFCNVDSNPPAVITWTRDTDPLKVIGTERHLPFRTTSPSQFGVYICQATAGTNFLPIRREVRVLQNDRPFISAEASVYAGQGDASAQIKCVINGLPLPTDVRWSKILGGDPQGLGRPVNSESDERVKITKETLSDRVVSHLTIKNVKKDDFGLYNCTASNNYGSADQLIPLKETDWMLPIIAGSACGGALLLVIIVVSAIFCIRCRSHNRLKEKASDTSGSTTTSDDLDIKSGAGVHHHHHHHGDMYTTTSNETLTDGHSGGKNGWTGHHHHHPHQQQDILHPSHHHQYNHPYTIQGDYGGNRKDGQNYYTRYADYEHEYNPNTFLSAGGGGLPAIYTPTLSLTGDHAAADQQDPTINNLPPRDPSPYHPSGLPSSSKIMEQQQQPLYARYPAVNGSVMLLDATLNSRLATNV